MAIGYEINLVKIELKCFILLFKFNMNIQNINSIILVLSGLLSVSEILPFINNTKGNGILHYLLTSLKNVVLKNINSITDDTNDPLINDINNTSDVDEIINISNQLKELKSELFLYLDSYNDYQNKNSNEYSEIIFQHLKDLQRKFDSQTNKLNEYISSKLNEQIDNKLNILNDQFNNKLNTYLDTYLNTYLDNVNEKLNDKLVEDLNKKLVYNFNETLNDNLVENKNYFEKLLNNNNENSKLILENCNNNEILAVLNEVNDVLKKKKKMNFFQNSN